MPDDSTPVLTRKPPPDPRVAGITTQELNEIAVKYWGSDEFTPDGIRVTWAKLTPREQTLALKLRKSVTPAAVPAVPAVEYVTRAEMQATVKAAVEACTSAIMATMRGSFELRDAQAAELADAHNSNVDGLDQKYEQIKALQAELAVMKAQLAEAPHDGGLYQRGTAYRKGALVTYAGSMFIARCNTSAEIGGNPPSPDWRLCVQRGRDGR